jgi:CubicO group peptidase (beta-lactamase class C family)
VTLGLLLIGCLPDGSNKIPYNDTPIDIGDGWPIATPAEVGVDPEGLREAYEFFFEDDEQFITATSLLVVRHGKLIGEGYRRDLDDRTRAETVQSATKSVTSMIVCAARAHGAPLELDQRLYDVAPEAFDDDLDKRDITLEHLLTMRSGIDFDNRAFSLEMVGDKPSPQLDYILSRPLYARPGEEAWYRDADPQMVSSMVQIVTGRTLADLGREYLLAPLGISDYLWLDNADGETYGAYGLYLRPRDLAKIGLLALQQGTWEGQELVPADWLAASTVRLGEEPTYYDNYGYYWWLPDEAFFDEEAPSGEPVAFLAAGHGGNFALVMPDEDLLVVITAMPDTIESVGVADVALSAVTRPILAALVD